MCWVSKGMCVLGMLRGMCVLGVEGDVCAGC